MKKKISKLPFKGTAEQEAQLNAVIAENCHDKSNVMVVMQKAQDIYGYLPLEVQEMIADKKSAKSVRNYIITVKFGNISGNKDLDPKQAVKIADLLDEAYPKGVFKELNSELRKAAAAAKKA